MGLFSRLNTFFQGRQPSASPMKPIGTMSTVVSDGYVYNTEADAEFNNPLTRYKKYSEFLLNIDIVGAGVRGFLRLVGGADWKCVPPTVEKDGIPEGLVEEAEEKAQLADRILHDMEQPWFRIVRKAALYPFFGAHVGVWTAKRREDGATGLASIDTRPIATITRWDMDEHGKLYGCVQQPPGDFEERYLPRGRMVYLVADDITDSPEGVGLLRHIAVAVKFLQRYMQLEGYGYETDLRGIPLARVPISAINQAVKNKDITAAEGQAMIDFIDKFLANHLKNPELGLRLESAVYRDTDPESKRPSATRMWDLELLKGEAGPHQHIHVAIERQVRYIARVLGVEHLLLGGDGKGSLALSEDKSIMFAQFIQSTLDDLAWTFRADVLRPLWLLNGWDLQTLPYLQPSAIALQDIVSVTTALKDMATAGATMMPNDPAINEVRKRLNISPAPEMDVKEMGELRAAMGGRMLEDPNAVPPRPGQGAQGAPGRGKKPAPRGKKPDERAAAKAFLDELDQNRAALRELFPLDDEPTVAKEFLAKADGHGVMIALYPPRTVAQALSQTGGADLDALHVTVAYLGKDLDAEDIASVVRVVQRWAAEIPWIKGSFSGVGRFSASSTSDGKDVAYASLDSPSLTAERPRLIEMLERAGLPAKTDHGYTPHLTLAYIGQDEPHPMRRLEPTEVTFGSVAVSAGLARIVIEFPGEHYDAWADKHRRRAS